jgi:hypothetical protein
VRKAGRKLSCRTSDRPPRMLNAQSELKKKKKGSGKNQKTAPPREATLCRSSVPQPHRDSNNTTKWRRLPARCVRVLCVRGDETSSRRATACVVLIRDGGWKNEAGHLAIFIVGFWRRKSEWGNVCVCVGGGAYRRGVGKGVGR